MKKLTIALSLLLILAFAVPAFALGRIAGPSPQQNDLEVSVRIPQRVGIDLSGDNIEFFLDLVPLLYPPDLYPAYYFPTNAVTPHVPLSVFCNAPSGWDLEVIASGDFDPTLPVTQLYFAPAGEAQTADGAAAPGGTWTAFSAAANVPVASNGARTVGWEAYDQDYELQITGNEAILDPEVTVTITYTITAI